MLFVFSLRRIALLGVLSLQTVYAQDRFESIAITLTAGQSVSRNEIDEPAADGYRTELAPLQLTIPEIVKTEISLVTIVQVSTTTIKEVVRVTKTLSGTCAAALVNLSCSAMIRQMLTGEQSPSTDPFAISAANVPGPASIPASSAEVVGIVVSIVPYTNSTQASNRSSPSGPTNTGFQPSAPSSRPCDCQCLCPVASFPPVETTTTSTVSVMSTFQTVPYFVTPGQSVLLLTPSEPSQLVPIPTALDAAALKPGNLPFDIKTFSLLDEVTVPVSI